MKTILLSLGAAATMLGAVALPAAPAAAQSYGDRYYSQRYDDGRYDRRGYREYRGDRGYAYRGRYNNRCKDGDGGTVIGAIAGGLLGNQVVGRGDRLLGTVLGGAVGAVAGRAIDRSDAPRGCRR